MKELTLAEVAAHNRADSCWVIIHGRVYDVTEFLNEHPGGPASLLENAGRDATAAYDTVHYASLVSQHLKPLGTCSAPVPPTPASTPAPAETSEKPLLSSIMSSHDFALAAERYFSPKAWAFISSSATDTYTHSRLNAGAPSQILLLPRILRNVAACSTSTTILGVPSAVPFFIAPTAMQKLVHPTGELALTAGAAADGVITSISTSSSYPLSEIVPSAPAGHPFWLQLYVNKDRPKTATLLQTAKSFGVRAILLTVDAPVMGKRELDERVPAPAISSGGSGEVLTTATDGKGGGLGRRMGTYVDPAVTWGADLHWIKEQAGGIPLVLKGVQTAADAKLAAESGVVDAIYLSNHGGRSLDTSPPALLTLLEIHRYCPEVLGKLQILVDGGFRRGTDIFKALCLGATGVGIGRPYLYALGYGEEGVRHLTGVLKDELETTMRMCGVTRIEECHPGLVNTVALEGMMQGGRGGRHPWIVWKGEGAKAKL
ncbi:FMN-dependent dehydrogenase-domain-containing protein [Geopyxis carbonaria]|nr:FMN-dependent dehydrogenase-domain-containing protein [Geopyxis carbonaria]